MGSPISVACASWDTGCGKRPPGRAQWPLDAGAGREERASLSFPLISLSPRRWRCCLAHSCLCQSCAEPGWASSCRKPLAHCCLHPSSEEEGISETLPDPGHTAGCLWSEPSISQAQHPPASARGAVRWLRASPEASWGHLLHQGAPVRAAFDVDKHRKLLSECHT